MIQRKVAKDQTKRTVRGAAVVSDGLEGVSFFLGRAYYRYIALVERALEEAGVADRVQPGMGHVLFTLFEEDDRLIKEIAGRTDVSPSTLTGILKRMEKNGLVRCRADENDGRAVRVQLTPRGKSLEKRLRDAQVRVQKIMYADVSAAEIATIKQTLARMTTSMSEHEIHLQPRKKGIAR